MLTSRPEIVGPPELRPFRKELLQTNLSSHRRLHAQRPDDPAVALALGRALIGLGHIFRDEPGGMDEAGTCYREAIDVLGELTSRHPDATEARCELAAAHAGLAEAPLSQGRPAEAVPSLRRACEEYDRLLKDGAALNESVLGSVTSACVALSSAYRDLGQPEEALTLAPLAQVACDRLREKCEQDGPASNACVVRGYALQHLGMLQRNANRPREAAATHREQLALAEALARARPDDPAARKLVTDSMYVLARAHDESGDPAEALRLYRRCAELLEERVKQQPDDRMLTWGLAAAHHCAGNILRETGEPGDAVAAYRRAVELREKMCAVAPSEFGLQESAAGTWGHLGEALEQLRQPEEAREAFRKERDHLQTALERQPGNASLRRRLETCERRLAGLGRGTKASGPGS